eukprot:16247-Heterococcus_DN1.PRE.4
MHSLALRTACCLCSAQHASTACIPVLQLLHMYATFIMSVVYNVMQAGRLYPVHYHHIESQQSMTTASILSTQCIT